MKNGLLGEGVVCDVNKRASCNVHKVKLLFLFHVFWHSSRDTGKFFVYVLLICGTLPAFHLLDLCVAVPGKGEGLCSTAAQGVGTDAVDWDSLLCLGSGVPAQPPSASGCGS